MKLFLFNEILSKTMENLHRLFILDGLLQSHRYPIPLQTLLANLECSLATFKRLLQVLREQYGYPIRYSREQKGYYYDTTQTLPISGLWFNTDELQALLIIRQLLDSLQPSLLSSYFKTLAEHVDHLLAATGKTPVVVGKRINIVPIAHPHMDTTIFLPLCRATLDNRAVHLQYQDIQGHASERTVSPQRLVYYRSHWYLDAWCHLRKALRTFWVSGIQTLAVTEETAKVIDEEELKRCLQSSYGIFSGAPSQVAHLRFTGRAALRNRLAEWHPQQQRKIHTEGSVELWIPYHHAYELVMDILRYGEEAEVIAPEALKTAVIEQLKKTLAIYL